MAEAVSARIEPRPRAAPRAPVPRPLRPWLRERRTLAEWLDSLEDDPPPGEDMLPMNAPHAAAMRHAANVLEHRYRGRRAEVGFDLPVVFRLPDERGRLVAGRLSPDVFVALGVERDERRDEYDATVLPPPDFVLEVLSKSTWKRDEGPKLDAYALLGVRECFLFDATGRRAAPALRGFALSPAGARPLPEVRLADVSRGVPSAVLGLVAHVSARPTPSRGDGVPALALRWRDMETGEDLCTYAEEALAREAAEGGRKLAEQQLERAEHARERAEHARERAEHARDRADDARAVAERERDEMVRRNRELEALVRRLRDSQ